MKRKRPDSRSSFHFARACVLGLAIFRTTAAIGQTLYGFGPFQGSNDMFVYTIEPSTGVFTPIADAGDTGFSPANLDVVGRRLFYVNSPNLYELDLRSGANSLLPTFNVVEAMAYDRGHDRIYELSRNASQLTIFAVQPGIPNGREVAYLGTPDHVLSTTLDPGRGRLFFLTSAIGTTLYQVDLDTGVFSSISTGTLAAFSSAFLFFDSTEATLYAVARRAGDTEFSLLTIDTDTGVFTTRATLGPSVYTAALDTSKRRLFFTAPSSLFTLDLGTNAISSVPIARCCPTLFVAPALASAAVPALGSGFAVLLVGLLAAGGWTILSRRL
jgi:hypothetical protein